ncbi:CapA family protein [Bacteroidia bacterium]|nr:CapA family protein [Bacteroidia bacterium]
MGDICPTVDTQLAIESGNAKHVLGDVHSRIEKSDFSLCNVEFSMIDRGEAIVKTGPVLGAKTSAIDFFTNAGFDLLSLANNHIKDYGEEGVRSTLEVAREAGIPTVGAGLNLADAKLGYVQDVNGLKIGVMAFAEQEFNTATETSPGSSFLDLYTDFDKIKDFKATVDYLIVLYHGGIEYYEYPSPLLQKKCRKLVESGADFVSCQHSHIIGTRESYLDGEILYGQGNSVFGYREGSDSWNQGLVAKITLEQNANKITSSISYIAISAHERGGVEPMTETEGESVLKAFEGRSQKLTDDIFIQSEWIKFCAQQSDLVIPQLLGYNRWLIRLNRLSKGLLTRLFFSNQKRIVTRNLIRCEAHNEVIKTILK